MQLPINRIALLLPAVLIPVLGFAADTAPAEAAGNKLNYILIGLVCLVFILLFSILVLGNTLRQLSMVYSEKIKKARSESANAIKSIVLLVLASAYSTTALAQDAEAVAAPVGTQSINGIPAFDFYLIMGIIGLELVVILTLTFFIRLMVRLLNTKPETAVIAKKIIKVSFWDRFNKVVPIEKEQDIMLDHDYDGIRELDNSLPPWWKYGFYVSIVASVIYLWYYHAGGNGPSSYDEYMAEVRTGEEEKMAYLAKAANNVDENTVTMLDAAGIGAGQTIFQNSCAACHAKDGGGGVGPNLTDDYWLHGGSLKDVFKSIKYGWADKGMKSWKDDFSPNQIAQLASFVKSLKGTNPATPKEKQGQLFEDGKEDTPAKTDSTQTVAANGK